MNLNSLICSVSICENVVVILFVFFFQAEDGIRDLVRSRGLGDVYKRQEIFLPNDESADAFVIKQFGVALEQFLFQLCAEFPVSYTHLTLPTSDLV